MKKRIVLSGLLAAALTLSLTACGGDKMPEENPGPTPIQTSTPGPPPTPPLSPPPAATALMLQDAGVRQALSLTEEWSKVSSGQLAMGCIVARTDYIEENPQGVENFLNAYQDSIAYMSDPANLEDAAQLVAQYGITPNAAIARSAIPQCNLVCLTGDEMKSVLEAYYQVLFDADPTSIGGALPNASFYYGAQ